MSRLVASAVMSACAVLLGLLAPLDAASAASGSAGSEHWLMFEENLGSAELSLFITGDTATTGTVSGPELASIPFSVTPGQIVTVSIPPSLAATGSQEIGTKGIRVSAGAPVTVYGLNRLPATTDAFLGLPVDLLGTQYIVLDTPNTVVHNYDAAQFGIVATQDNTRVLITTRGSGTAALPLLISITLQEGQTYQLQNTGSGTANLTGTEIEASAPIAVFAGNRCTNIPGDGNYSACDHNVEQLFPTSSWGTRFITAPLATRTKGDTFRLVAQQDNTVVFLDRVAKWALNRGEYVETVLAGSHEWQTSAPVLLGQYSNSSSYDGVTSDPFMTLVPPTEQFLSRYTVATPPSGIAYNYVGLVAPTSGIRSITVDGSPVDANLFSPVGDSGFSAGQIQVLPGTHNLVGTMGFGLTVYGFDSFDSYGYPGGLGLAPIALDSDHDGLPDSWETTGYDFNGVHVPLNEWGADPHRKDLFLELDWMSTSFHLECNLINFWGGCTSVANDFAPSQAKLQEVVDVFAKHGINLHIDAGNRSPKDSNGKSWPDPRGGAKIGYKQYFASEGGAFFSALADARKQYLPPERNAVFHYGVIGDQIASDSTSSGRAQLPGDSFFVAKGTRIDLWSSDRQIERTIMHEFGHTLGIGHGGAIAFDDSNVNCKPKYISVMNYIYAHRGALDYSSDQSTGNELSLTDRLAVEDCKNSGGDPRVSGAYDVHRDWLKDASDATTSPMVFVSSNIGPLASGALYQAVYPDDPSMAQYEAAGLAAEDGDGTIRLVAPTVLFAGLDNQVLTFQAHNPGNVDAGYDVSVDVGGTTQSRSVSIPAHGTVTLEFNANSVSAGPLDVTAHIAKPSNSEVLASETVSLPVLTVDASTAQSLLDEANSLGTSVPAELKAHLVSELARAVTQFGVKLMQSITFAAPASPAVVGASAPLAGASTSALPVVFSVDASSTPGACTVTGSTVSYAAAGTCVIDADQAGNASYQAAPRVRRTVAVAYSSPGFSSPLPRTTLIKSASMIPVKFTLVSADGGAISPTTAGALAAARALTVTLAGSGVRAVTVPCAWDGVGLRFQCNLKTPSGLKTGTSNPYTITAYQAVPTGEGGTVGVPVSSMRVYFK